jgi:hypothetical protein
MTQTVINRAQDTDHLEQAFNRLDDPWRLWIDARIDVCQAFAVEQENWRQRAR